MTAARLVVGPFNRVEGDLEVTLEVAEGRVAHATEEAVWAVVEGVPR